VDAVSSRGEEILGSFVAKEPPPLAGKETMMLHESFQVGQGVLAYPWPGAYLVEAQDELLCSSELAIRPGMTGKTKHYVGGSISNTTPA
jgi:hypothetical protein